jgi:hypothetical protein
MASMEPHTPSRITPPAEAERVNEALRKAAYEVGYIRSKANEDRSISAADVADAFEAILDLVAPHWRMAQENG